MKPRPLLNEMFIYQVRTPGLMPRLRTFVMDLSITIDRWVDKLTQTPPDQITARDHIRWWIEGRITGPMFSWAWDGSDEEINSALNGECPRKYMSDRQRLAVYEAALDGEPLDEGYCQAWDGDEETDACGAVLTPDNHSDFCPDCRAQMPGLLLEDTK